MLLLITITHEATILETGGESAIAVKPYLITAIERIANGTVTTPVLLDILCLALTQSKIISILTALISDDSFESEDVKIICI